MADSENDKVVTVCYGEKREWNSREEAENYFLEAAGNSDGSEKDRYTNVLLDIIGGCSICTDGG